MTRVIVYEDVLNEGDRNALIAVGQVVSLSSVSPFTRPNLWNTAAFAEWIANTLRHIGYDGENDVIPLLGNYLALAQLLQVVAVHDHSPYKVPCLSFSRGDGGKAKFVRVDLHEGDSAATSIYDQGAEDAT